MIKTILVVDNDPLMLTFIKMLLRKKKYEIILAEDGLSALNILKTASPDVMFLDLIMPNISGDKLCQIIRKKPQFKDAYIVLLSGISAEEKIDLAKYGFDACIVKGPMNKTGEHILRILDQLENKSIRPSSKITLGYKDIQKRTVIQELLSRYKHFELILSNMSEGILELNPEGKIVFTNPSSVALFDVPEEKILASHFVSLFPQTIEKSIKRLLNELIQETRKRAQISPMCINERQVSVHLLLVKSDMDKSIIVILNDITERTKAEKVLKKTHVELEKRVEKRTEELARANMRLQAEILEKKRAEEQIRANLQEKELLIQEIHHRVKNNLQIVSSLLKLHSREIDNPEVIDILQEMYNRIRSIWMAHEKLYQSQDLTRIDFSEYIRGFARHLFTSYGMTNNHIKFDTNVPSPFFLSIDLAIPLGLIINELISNFIKHGIHESTEGKIRISIENLNGNRADLIVEDENNSLPIQSDIQDSQPLGLRIVHILADQIDGDIKIDTSMGTKFKLSFPLETTIGVRV